MLSRLSRLSSAPLSALPVASRAGGFAAASAQSAALPARQRGAESRRQASLMAGVMPMPMMVDEDTLQAMPPQQRALYRPVMMEAEIVRDTPPHGAPGGQGQKGGAETRPQPPEIRDVFVGLYMRAQGIDLP